MSKQIEDLLSKSLGTPLLGVDTIKIRRNPHDRCYFCNKFSIEEYYWTFSLGLWKGVKSEGAKGYKEEILICSNCFNLYINIKPERGEFRKFLKDLLQIRYQFNPSVR